MTKFLVLNFHAKHQIFNALNTWLLAAVNKLSKNNRSIVINELVDIHQIIALARRVKDLQIKQCWEISITSLPEYEKAEALSESLSE